MKKLFQRISVFVLCFAMTLSFIGCGSLTVEDTNGDGESETNATEIYIMNFGGGVGRIWLDKAVEEFKALKANESYETDKMGVKFEIADTTQTSRDTMSSSGNAIYFDQSIPSIKSIAAKGDLLDISDIMDDVIDTRSGKDVTLLDKINDDMEHSLKGGDGKFYALPHYEWFPGLTYDLDAFNANNLFLADSSVDANGTVAYECSIVGKTFRFIKNPSIKKSVGNDGIYGTADDGLPTTLEEFIALCDYMKKVYQMTPFTVAGGHIDYYSNLVGAMWSALAGAEEMTTSYTFNGKVKVVDSFENTPLFGDSDLTSIKKPIIVEKDVTSVADGYWTTQSVARYYAAAFTELAKIKDWFSADSKGSSSHSTTQTRFIMSGYEKNEKVGMLIEGSYWYNESVKSNAFDDYTYLTNKQTRNVAWMSMPSSYDSAVTENNGRKSVFLDYGSAYAFINANIANKEGLVRACKDFLKFLYTDAQLKAFTVNSGSVKAKIDYELTAEDMKDMSVFQKSIVDLRAKGKVVYQTADNDKAPSRMLDCNAQILKAFSSSCYLSAVRKGSTAISIFEEGIFDKASWGA